MVLAGCTADQLFFLGSYGLFSRTPARAGGLGLSSVQIRFKCSSPKKICCLRSFRRAEARHSIGSGGRSVVGGALHRVTHPSAHFAERAAAKAVQSPAGSARGRVSADRYGAVGTAGLYGSDTDELARLARRDAGGAPRLGSPPRDIQPPSIRRRQGQEGRIGASPAQHRPTRPRPLPNKPVSIPPRFPAAIAIGPTVAPRRRRGPSR